LSKAQHNILAAFKDRGQYPGMDGAGQVRKLLAGLLDPRLAAVKAQILANEDLLHDFDSAVQLCQRSIDLSVSIPTHA
jgi:hypothetical protein